MYKFVCKYIRDTSSVRKAITFMIYVKLEILSILS